MAKWLVWLFFAALASVIEVTNGVSVWVGCGIYICGILSNAIGNAVDK